jgi:hypothetical protein
MMLQEQDISYPGSWVSIRTITLENNLVRPKKPKINKPFNPEALFVDLSPKTMVINDGSQWNSLGHLKKKNRCLGPTPLILI